MVVEQDQALPTETRTFEIVKRLGRTEAPVLTTKDGRELVLVEEKFEVKLASGQEAKQQDKP
jgi:hypothetical protein